MRFFVSQSDICGSAVKLSEEDVNHISRVLRMREGEEIVVCDDAGREHLCRIDSINKGGELRVSIQASGSHSTEPDVFVTVYAGLSKGERFDYLIQKCVEVGAAHIVPVLTERCIARPDTRDYSKKQQRFAKIALEASKQARRSRPVTVGGIVALEAALAALKNQNSLFLYENEGQSSLKTVLESFGRFSSVNVLTGPEGGFTDKEAELVKAAGARSVSIGPRIMRCETAPVAAVCAIMYHTGNFNVGV